MSEQSEQVEGQALATSLLAAVRAGKPDWADFLRAYQVDLRRVAQRCQARSSLLQREFSGGPDELVSDFLAHKLLPPAKACAMLGPAAAGQKPLRLRLLASLENHCIDLGRKGRRLPSTAGESADPPAPLAQELPTFEAVEELIQQQTEAIRKTFERSRAKAPYCETLLLVLRLYWVRLVGLVLPRDWGQGTAEVTIQTVLERTPWLPAEAGRAINEQGLTLAQGWDRLETSRSDSPVKLTADRIAEHLGISPNIWYAWVSRGRRKLVNHLGSAFTELFPHWQGENSQAEEGKEA